MSISENTTASAGRREDNRDFTLRNETVPKLQLSQGNQLAIAPSSIKSTSSLAFEAKEALTRARSVLVMEHPFFATLSLRLRLKADDTCTDLWTDGKTLGYNTVYAATLPLDKMVGALAHEVLHIAFSHHLRRKERTPDLWNKACDLSINPLLLEAGFSLPQGFAYDAEYVGMGAAEIYEKLLALQVQEEGKRGQLSEETEPADKSSVSDGAGGEQGEDTLDESQQHGRGNENGSDENSKKQSAQGNDGSSDTDSQSLKKMQPAEFFGEVRDLGGDHEDGGEEAQNGAGQEVDIAVTQAIESALHMGDMPAGFLRLLRQEWRLELDWRELLQRFLENCADNDYSWTMPNRRYWHQDIYLPSRQESRLPHVVLAIDSSGSIEEKVLAAFCDELSVILDAYDTTLTVLFHDNRIQKVESFTRADLPLNLAPVGGGGTDFRPVGEYIQEKLHSLTCLIWFTDLECSLFPPEPEFPVLWVCSRRQAESPPFGEMITVTALA